MRHAAVALLLGLLLINIAPGHEDDFEASPDPFTEAVQHHPTPLPDRVAITWSGDPTTSIDVTWRTDPTTGEPLVQYAPADSARGDLQSGNLPSAEETKGERTPFETDLGLCHMHTAKLTGLEPATMYMYRVGDGSHWSEWFQFRTASEDPEPFTFVYFGDAQNAVRSMWSRVVREANQYAPRAAFMLHAGDLINNAHHDAQWGEWFGAGGWLNGMIPSVATPGNHEYAPLPGHAEEDRRLSDHWRPCFSFPTNGPDGLEETTYWLDYQGLRIISLNSNEQIEKQTSWLEKVLSDPNRPKWTVVTFHHPVFSAAKDRDNPTIREAWRPVFEKHGVDLVLQGHDHTYARSGQGGPKNFENVPDGVCQQSSNTVYVVSVSGPKMYPLEDAWDVSRIASGVQLFQVIHVSPDKVRYEARLASGKLYDAFTLVKNDEGRSVLVEDVPAVEAIRD